MERCPTNTETLAEQETFTFFFLLPKNIYRRHSMCQTGNMMVSKRKLCWQSGRWWPTGKSCCCCSATAVVSDSVRPRRWQPTRLPRPWDSPGKNTGVGCQFLLQCMKVKTESEVAQSCPTLSNPMDCSLLGSSVHGIFQARVLEWGAIAFSIGKS